MSQTKSNDFKKIVEKLERIENEFPGLLISEFFDHIDPLYNSAKTGKYPVSNWMEPAGKCIDVKSNYASVGRHVAHAHTRQLIDKDSGLYHQQHGACRLMMDYVRLVRGIKHPDDPIEGDK